MSATGDTTPTDRILETVTAWSLTRHAPASPAHAWTLTATRAILAGTAIPAWPGQNPRVGEGYLHRLRRLVSELGGPTYRTPRVVPGPAGTVPT